MSALPAIISSDDAVRLLMADTAPVGQGTRLLPVETCKALIREYSDIGQVGNEIAVQQTKVLMGSYPREPHDPETFIRGIASVLAEQPPEIGKIAIDRLTRRLKHTPTRAELCEVIDEVLAERRAIASRARAHMAERDRRAAEQAKADQIEADRQTLRDTLGPSWDAWWSIPIFGRYAGGTPEQFRAGWDKASDKDAFVQSWGSERGAV